MSFLLSPSPGALFSFAPSEFDTNFAGVSNVSIPPHKEIVRSLNGALNKKMADVETVEEMAHASEGVSGDAHVWVREYDLEERAEVEKLMEVSSELLMVRRILQVGFCLHGCR